MSTGTQNSPGVGIENSPPSIDDGWFFGPEETRFELLLEPVGVVTDTLYIEFRSAAIAETRDLDENTLLDVDADGNICAITVEHASERAEIPAFSYEQIAA